MVSGIYLIILAALVFVVVAVVVYFVSIYNGLVRLSRNIDKSWANIDVILKQRNDELAKLIEVCKGYMNYEKSVLSNLTELRSGWMKATTVSDKANISNMISDSLKSLFAVAENYPNLKANENFLQLQNRISGLESELADRREFYNDSVTIYNIRIKSIPDMWIAGKMHYQPVDLFKVAEEDKKDVEIKF
ncbi:MAG: LemA family protein [Candidatus Methanoperedens sp.]|nr:LemA family protein [Candidatus Methanoperedens sp.]